MFLVAACRALSLLPLLILAVSLPAVAQKTRLLASAGAAATYVANGNRDVKYIPRLAPVIQLSALVPVGNRFDIKTGIGYEQWFWDATRSYTDSAGTESRDVVSPRLHLCNIPLQLSVNVLRTGKWQLAASLGMTYCFVTAASARWTSSTYRNGELRYSNSIEFTPTVSLIPDGARVKASYDYATFRRFVASAQADVTIGYKDRYFVQLFVDYGTTELTGGDLRALPLQSRHLGATLGYRLR